MSNWNEDSERKAPAAPPAASTAEHSKLKLLVVFGTAVCLQAADLVIPVMGNVGTFCRFLKCFKV